MVTIRVTCINNLYRDCGTACDAVIVGVEARCGELIAGTAGTSTIWLAGAVQGPVKEFLVDGGVVDTRAAAPLP